MRQPRNGRAPAVDAARGSKVGGAGAAIDTEDTIKGTAPAQSEPSERREIGRIGNTISNMSALLTVRALLIANLIGIGILIYQVSRLAR